MYVHHNTNHKQINVTIKYEIKLLVVCLEIWLRSERLEMLFIFSSIICPKYPTIQSVPEKPVRWTQSYFYDPTSEPE